MRGVSAMSYGQIPDNFSPDRQRSRGLASGQVRQEQRVERNNRIVEHRRGGWKTKCIARKEGLSRVQTWRIIKGVVATQGQRQ